MSKSKVTQYRVVVEGKESVVDTMKELSKLVGRKVSRAMVENGEVPEVVEVIVPVEETPTKGEDGIEDNMEEGEDNMNKAFVKNDEGGYNELPLHDPLHRNVEDITAATNDEITEDEVDDMEDELNNDGTLTCEYCKREITEDEKYVNDDNGNITCMDCARELGLVEDSQDDNNEDNDKEPGNNGSDNDNNGDTGKPDIKSLMAKMKELNAKKGTTEEDSTKKGKRGKTVDAKKYVEENNGYPEKGYFKTEQEIKKFYKQLEPSQIEEWLAVEGLDYKKSDNEPINRMRACMALLYYHFPRESKGSSKKESKYAKYSIEDLLQMALDNNIEVPEGKGDLRIMRMYAIMALKKAGVLE
jgi:hypothetical protein